MSPVFRIYVFGEFQKFDWIKSTRWIRWWWGLIWLSGPVVTGRFRNFFYGIEVLLFQFATSLVDTRGDKGAAESSPWVVGSHLIMWFLLACAQQLGETGDEVKALDRPRAQQVLVLSIHAQILGVISFSLFHSVWVKIWKWTDCMNAFV